MKNAIKNLMKVDEFLTKTERENKVDPLQINEAITDIRDALNMLNN